MLTMFQSIAEPWLLFLSDDPTLRMLQGGMLLAGVLLIFLVFYVTKDILLRTHSFLYMFVSILVTAALPVVGFFLYLLIRPSRTLAEKENESLLREILVAVRLGTQTNVPSRKDPLSPKKKKKGGGDISLD